MIVAIDGPSAAGKGTLARRLAAAFDFAFLDTGLLYRAAALRLSLAGGDAGDAAAAAAARAVTAADLDQPGLRSDAIGRLASRVSAIPEVRAALLGLQRRFAAAPPGGKAGAVLDGRDIGTVVCPQAEVKLFVTASLAARARRRTAELRAAGETVDEATVRASLARRDADDAGRPTAPMRPAADAHLLDTTDLDIEGAFDAARSIVAARLGMA